MIENTNDIKTGYWLIDKLVSLRKRLGVHVCCGLLLTCVLEEEFGIEPDPDNNSVAGVGKPDVYKLLKGIAKFIRYAGGELTLEETTEQLNKALDYLSIATDRIEDFDHHANGIAERQREKLVMHELKKEK